MAYLHTILAYPSKPRLKGALNRIYGYLSRYRAGTDKTLAMLPRQHFQPKLFHAADHPIGLFTDDGVALGVGVQSSEERHAGRFLLALGETGTGGGDAGRRIHLVRAHCGSGIGIRCDHHDAAALLAQGLDLAFQVRARESAQTLDLACR